MSEEFTMYLSKLLKSNSDDNGGNVIELIFDLKMIGIETLNQFIKTTGKLVHSTTYRRSI